jgi:alpha-methylacyl-CoA racemase
MGKLNPGELSEPQRTYGEFNQMSLPLANVRVLDLTRLLPGGLCSLMLADMGADVIKIESPDGGDYLRWMSPISDTDGQSLYFHALNRNKRSVVLDLKDEIGQAVLQHLSKTADILIEGYRPEVMKRLNCDYEALREFNPKLIYCSISGWGQDSPRADQGAHDLNYVSQAGLVSAMKDAQPLGGQVADVGGAYVAVSSLLAALFRRERTGEGAYLDVSLFDSALPFAALPWMEAMATPQPEARGMLTGSYAFYNVYEAKDGEPVALSALEPDFWENFCRAIRRPDLIENYADPARQRYLRNELGEIFSLRSADEWEQLLGDVDCCFSRVTETGNLAENLRTRARGALGVDANGLPWLRSPIRLELGKVERSPAPYYGEQTREVLQEAGYSAEEIEGMVAAGVIGQSQ